MKKFALSWMFLALAWVWGGSAAQATIALTLVPSASSVALNGTITVTATVSGTTNLGLTWSVNGVTNGNTTVGTLSSCTTTAPLHCTYQAPPVNVPSPNPVTFKIVSVADGVTNITATATVTDSIAVTLSPTSASPALSGTQLFTAGISGTSNTALNWYVNGVFNGNSTQGTLSGSGLTRTYKAPPLDVPSPNPAVVKVASAADPAKFKTASVTVTDSIVVSLSPTSASPALSGTQLFTAGISGTSNTALNWYVNGVLNGNSTQGTLSGSGLTRTYMAPAINVPSPNPAVVKVASAADPGKFKTANVTVTDSIAVTLSPSSASPALSGTQLFTAGISGTSNTALNWYVNGVLNGNSTQGTLSGSGLTRTYTAPAINVPSPNPAVVKVASAADPGKFKTANVTVTDSIAVTLSPSSATVALNGSQLFTAGISGTTNTALNWYVNGVLNGSTAQGTLTGTGLTRTYKAPSGTPPSPNPAVVKVASAADPGKFKTSNVTVGSGVAVAITSPTNPTSVVRGGTLPITASVTGATASLTWTVNGVSNGNATFGTITGTYPSYTYNAPAAIPGGNNPVTLEATQATTLQTASLTVTITASSTVPNAINVPGNNVNATGVNLSISTVTPTLALAAIGACTPTCSAGVSAVTVAKGTSVQVWVLGQGLTNGTGSAVASGVTFSVSQGSVSDVTINSISPHTLVSGLTNVFMNIQVSASAASGPRNLIVTNGTAMSVLVGQIIIP